MQKIKSSATGHGAALRSQPTSGLDAKRREWGIELAPTALVVKVWADVAWVNPSQTAQSCRSLRSAYLQCGSSIETFTHVPKY